MDHMHATEMHSMQIRLTYTYRGSTTLQYQIFKCVLVSVYVVYKSVCTCIYTLYMNSPRSTCVYVFCGFILLSVQLCSLTKIPSPPPPPSPWFSSSSAPAFFCFQAARCPPWHAR